MSNEGEIELFEPSCPVCGGLNFLPLAANDRYGMQLRTSGCAGCGLLQTWPRPTPASMASFYRYRYRQTYQGTNTADAQYASRFRKDLRLANTAKLIAEHATLPDRARLLDVGCAEGTLFAKLNELADGLEFFGIEPFDEFARYARDTTGCRTFPTLEDLAVAGVSGFDIVVVNHVLEHVDDPVAFLRTLRSFLSPAGRIYIDVPDAERYASPESLHLAHLFHFSPATLRAVAVSAGLDVVYSGRHRPPHHPASVWAVVAPREAEHLEVETSPASERASWRAVRRLRLMLPAYLVAVELYRTRPGRLIGRLVRRLRR